jgi:flagellar FliL protein
MKKVIYIASGGLLLAAITTGALLFLLGNDTPTADTKPVATAAVEKSGGDNKEPPVYYSFDPDFVIAFEKPKTARFLKVSMDLMTRDEDVIETIKLHRPAIRDSVLMLLSGKSEDDLMSRDGKEQLRAEVLAEVQGVLTKATGKSGVEAVYFTSFVMQ